MGAVNPSALVEVHKLQDVYEVQFYAFTVLSSIASLIGAIALVITAGIYGFVSFLASQRTKEIGIRMALGASKSEVRCLMMRQVIPSSL